jgi:hypothetical protein
MIRMPAIPGLYYESVRPAERSPLRTDIAAFVGRTRRGAVGVPQRVEGWRGYARTFGALQSDCVTPYAVRGYFENGGDIAWIVRLAPADGGVTPAPARGRWDVGIVENGAWIAASPSRHGFPFEAFDIVATSPGNWGNRGRVTIDFRLVTGDRAEVDVAVAIPGEEPEFFTAVTPDMLAATVAGGSALVRFVPAGPATPSVPAVPAAAPGPRAMRWVVTLESGIDAPRSGRAYLPAYLEAASRLADIGEVALMSVPDLHSCTTSDDDRLEIVRRMLEDAERLHDRLLLLDAPPPRGIRTTARVFEWIAAIQNDVDLAARAAALYFPHLVIPDPLGTVRRPQRIVPPSGHVAGVISRLDRQLGAHHTPANTPLTEAVDLAETVEARTEIRLRAEGVNLFKCSPSRGLQIWGGRVLRVPGERLPPRFMAHRRLIHRLVRAIRRVAEPLVFEVNGPELWLAFVRSATSVLVEAFQAGALKGSRPDEGFRVRCDGKTNPPDAVDDGRCVCEIEIAPAAPMEFILIRVALSADGSLELLES